MGLIVEKTSIWRAFRDGMRCVWWVGGKVMHVTLATPIDVETLSCSNFLNNTPGIDAPPFLVECESTTLSPRLTALWLVWALGACSDDMISLFNKVTRSCGEAISWRGDLVHLTLGRLSGKNFEVVRPFRESMD
jgi:2'-5' RNA ligase